jgi:hypothetical protein
MTRLARTQPQPELQSMTLAARRLCLLTCLAVLCWSGCATLDKNHQSPRIDVVGITKAESDTSAMQFTILL